MSFVPMRVAILAATLIATGAQAAPTIPVANIVQFQPKKGAPAKIILYKNKDVTKTSSAQVRTPIYGPVYDKQGNVIGTKIVGYSSKTVKSTVITPGAQLLTTNGSGTTLSSPIVNFQYLAKLPAAYQAQLSGIQSAYFTLDAVSTSAPVISGGFVMQLFDSGTITFKRTTPIQFYSPSGNPIGAPKSNLLSITFRDAVYSGQLGGTSAALAASTRTAPMSFTSDFLNFSNASDFDLSLAFNAAGLPISLALVSPTLTNVSGATSLITNRSNVVGTFGASSVPEPASWAMLITGFALVGWRRRSIGHAAHA